MEIRLSDTGTSRPAGWRYLPPPGVDAPLGEVPALDDRNRPLPPVAPAIDNNSEAETSCQAAIVKIKAENSGSVGCGGEAVSSREERDSREIQDVHTEAAPQLRRKNIKRGADDRNPGRLEESNNNSNLDLGESIIDLTVDARVEAEGADKSGGGGGGGNQSKRQKVLAGGIKTSKRHRTPNKGLKAVVENGEANKEGNRTENGSNTEFPDRQRDGHQEVGWTVRFWEAVQRFAGRI